MGIITYIAYERLAAQEKRKSALFCLDIVADLLLHEF